MALYALLRSNPSASAEDIEKGLDGNLCRCTGEGFVLIFLVFHSGASYVCVATSNGYVVIAFQ